MLQRGQQQLAHYRSTPWAIFGLKATLESGRHNEVTLGSDLTNQAPAGLPYRLFQGAPLSGRRVRSQLSYPELNLQGMLAVR